MKKTTGIGLVAIATLFAANILSSCSGNNENRHVPDSVMNLKARKAFQADSANRAKEDSIAKIEELEDMNVGLDKIKLDTIKGTLHMEGTVIRQSTLDVNKTAPIGKKVFIDLNFKDEDGGPVIDGGRNARIDYSGIADEKTDTPGTIGIENAKANWKTVVYGDRAKFPLALKRMLNNLDGEQGYQISARTYGLKTK